MINITAVILAGGLGRRLWPLSNHLCPKQFAKLNEQQDRSMFQMAVERSMELPIRDIIVSTNQLHRHIIDQEIDRYNDCDFHIILEPSIKNTLPAITAATTLSSIMESDIAVIMPSDHLFENNLEFTSCLKNAIHYVTHHPENILIFGKSITEINTSYGYIRRGDQIKNSIYAVHSFIEKPNNQNALKYVHNSICYHNIGILIGYSKTILNGVKKYNEKSYNASEMALKTSSLYGSKIILNPYYWDRNENISMDYGFLEKTDNLVVMPMDTSWHDIGEWKSLSVASVRDGDNNSINGDVTIVDVTRSYIDNRSNTELIVSGLSDVDVYVDNNITIISSKKGMDQKTLYTIAKNRCSTNTDTIIHYSWGSVENIFINNRCTIRKIHIRPWQITPMRISHCYNKYIDIFCGSADLEIGESPFDMKKTNTASIEQGKLYRILNTSDAQTTILEINESANIFHDIWCINDTWDTIHNINKPHHYLPT